ncbi:MAG: sulfite exporter TauE/SafE family protein [Acetobacteraceae bacterium]
MLTALCGPDVASGGLFLGLFLAGLAGSTLHCVPMCGGFVLGQAADRMAKLPAAHLCEWRRVARGALLPYHLGRLTTYAALGAVAGVVLQRLPWFAAASAALLTLGALLFVAQAIHRLSPAMLPALDRVPAGWSRTIGRAAGYAGGGYRLGVVLGFLPCGFLYAALAAAAGSGGPVQGALSMLAFGLGTIPALAAVAIAGQTAARRWQRGVARAAPAVLLVNAALLLVIALTPSHSP